MPSPFETIEKVLPEITILGETIQDIWWFGRRGKLSQEVSHALGIFEMEKEIKVMGGAANVDKSLFNILPRPGYIDYYYEFNLVWPYVSMKYRMVVGKEIVFRMDRDIVETEWNSFNPSRENLIIADYGKGMFSWEVLNRMARSFRGKRIVFSPHITTCQKATPSNILSKEILESWIWIMNWDEFATLPIGARPEVSIVTRGKGGVGLHYRGETAHYVPSVISLPSRVVDAWHTCGIGDVFLAAFSALHFSNGTIEDSIRFGMRCCEIVLKADRPGTHCFALEDKKNYGNDTERLGSGTDPCE